MDLKRAIEFLVRTQAQSQARFEARMERSDERMDRIEATLDRLSSKAAEHERWIVRHEHILAAFIETSRRNGRENALEHRRFREEMRALGRRMDNWLRRGRDGRGRGR